MKLAPATGSLALTLCTATLAPPTIAAVALTFSEDGKPAQTLAVLNDEVAMTTGDGEVMVYSSIAGRLEIRNYTRGTYYVLDPEAMAQRAAQAKSQMSQMQSQMAPMAAQMEQQMQALLSDPTLTEQQKAMIRDQIRQMQAASGGQPATGMPMRAPSYSTRATGQRRTLSGIDCADHVVYKDERPDTGLCIAPHRKVGVSDQDYGTIRDFFAFMREMSRRMMAVMGQQGGPDETSFPDVDGLPVESRDLNDGTISRLESVSQQVDPTLFKRDANMREVDPFRGG